MEWIDIDSRACSIARTLDLLGDRWTLLVLRDLSNGVRRFADLQSHLGIARNVLTQRLTTLVESGVAARVPYREPGARTRYEYELTDRGHELRTVLLALIAWGDRHLAGTAGPPVLIRHAGCGAELRLRTECADGHPIDLTTPVTVEPGPGAVPAAS